jgi:hypothetical protein
MQVLLILSIFASSQAQILSGVQLVLINFQDASSYSTAKLSWENITQTLKPPIYDANKKTVLFIYGWNDNLSSDCVTRIIAAYATRKATHNILILDWSTFSTQMYLRAVGDVDRVSD